MRGSGVRFDAARSQSQEYAPPPLPLIFVSFLLLLDSLTNMKNTPQLDLSTTQPTHALAHSLTRPLAHSPTHAHTPLLHPTPLRTAAKTATTPTALRASTKPGRAPEDPTISNAKPAATSSALRAKSGVAVAQEGITTTRALTARRESSNPRPTTRAATAPAVAWVKFLAPAPPTAPCARPGKLPMLPKTPASLVLRGSTPPTGPNARNARSAKCPRRPCLDHAKAAPRARQPTWATQRAAQCARIALRENSSTIMCAKHVPPDTIRPPKTRKIAMLARPARSPPTMLPRDAQSATAANTPRPSISAAA
jgi:hypothetical protein